MQNPAERKHCMVRLHQPDLEEVKSVLQAGLTNCFTEVNVRVVECPNLILAPFHLAARGLCGNPIAMEVGGIENIKQDKPEMGHGLNILDLIDQYYNKPSFVIGASARTETPIILAYFIDDVFVDFTYVREPFPSYYNQSRIIVKDERRDAIKEWPLESKCDMFGNFFISEGMPGKVLEVCVKQRLTIESFVTVMRDALRNKYGSLYPVGLGGTFLMKEGLIQHDSISSKYFDGVKTIPLSTYICETPLVAVGTMFSFDSLPQITDNWNYGQTILITDNRFNSHKSMTGGRYINDLTPDTVEYLGYFQLATEFHCVDLPRPS